LQREYRLATAAPRNDRHGTPAWIGFFCHANSVLQTRVILSRFGPCEQLHCAPAETEMMSASRAPARYHGGHGRRDTCRACELDAMVTRVADPARLPALLVAAGCHGRPGPDVYAPAGRSCLRAGLRSPGHLRSVRDNRAVARVRHIRSQSHPRA